ncbi:hypothetical protein FQN50_008562 [Emmonsiellopsis sp. PD_5]|nr:hypothetical protein FQN50_008562 [Emmonsiellopsis sp. PD_5]
MAPPPDTNNLKQQLLRSHVEARQQLEAHKRQLEREYEEAMIKKSNQKKFPWSPEAWKAAGEAHVRGEYRGISSQRFPILFTPSGPGPFTTPEKIQEAGSLESAPGVIWSTESQWGPIELEPTEEDSQKNGKARVQYCDVGFKEWKRIKEKTEGEDVVIWFNGKRRFAWLAHSMKQKLGE